MNLPQIDTKSKYYKMTVVWLILSVITFVVLIFLNRWLEANLWALGFIAVTTMAFLTGWIFRNTYND